MQGNRGKALETLVESTNNIYRNQGKAVIDKVPTPWSVQYDKRTKRVRNARPQKKGTVDFTGVANGKYINFDAKSTKNKTSFPLANMEEHQYTYLRDCEEQGGISFVLIEFSLHREIFYMTYQQLHKWWIGSKRGERKSIPLAWIRDHCKQVTTGSGVPLNYLAVAEGSA